MVQWVTRLRGLYAWLHALDASHPLQHALHSLHSQKHASWPSKTKRLQNVHMHLRQTSETRSQPGCPHHNQTVLTSFTGTKSRQASQTFDRHELQEAHAHIHKPVLGVQLPKMRTTDADEQLQLGKVGGHLQRQAPTY
eukprot:1142468-Pelagomonas_calceolata.AAC.1